jgi:hypothetical protein
LVGQRQIASEFFLFVIKNRNAFIKDLKNIDVFFATQGSYLDK